MIFILLGALSDIEKDLINSIFSKINVKLYNISFNILRSHSDAEEAVSQTFLKIMNHIEKVSSLPCPQIEPYCVIILKNETMNIIRQYKKTAYVEYFDYFECDENDYDIEEEYIKMTDMKRLLSCIDKLSDEEKFIIHLRFINDMRFKQISELLDVSEEAVKKRGQRILKKLRLYYEEGEKNAQYG